MATTTNALDAHFDAIGLRAVLDYPNAVLFAKNNAHDHFILVVANAIEGAMISAADTNNHAHLDWLNDFLLDAPKQIDGRFSECREARKSPRVRRLSQQAWEQLRALPDAPPPRFSTEPADLPGQRGTHGCQLARVLLLLAMLLCSSLSAATAPISLPDLIEAVRAGKLTQEQWAKLPAAELVCDSNTPRTDLRLTLMKGQHAIVVPSPTDKWQGEVGSPKVTYVGAPYGQEEFNHACMIASVSDDDAKARPVAKDPVLEGPGKIYVWMHCPGATKHIGLLHLKVLLLP